MPIMHESDFVGTKYSVSWKEITENRAWSIGILSRRMCNFRISYIDTAVPLQDVQAAVKNELDGLIRRLLGYRARILS